MKINAHSYKACRENIRGDRLRKLINLMLRSAECGKQDILEKKEYLLIVDKLDQVSDAR